MKQDINLYQDVLIEKPAPFQFGTAVMVTTAVLLLVIGLAGFSYWSAEKKAEHVTAERQREAAKQAYVADLQIKHPVRQPNPLLINKLAALERQLAEQKEALHYVKDNQLAGNNIIFAALQGLAQQHVKDLWLSKVALTDQGRHISLSGSALNELAIPEFVRVLGDAHIFGGAVFDNLTIVRADEPGGYIEFSLITKGEQR